VLACPSPYEVLPLISRSAPPCASHPPPTACATCTAPPCRYTKALEPFYDSFDPEFINSRKAAREILQKEDDLNEIVQLVGKVGERRLVAGRSGGCIACRRCHAFLPRCAGGSTGAHQLQRFAIVGPIWRVAWQEAELHRLTRAPPTGGCCAVPAAGCAG
jgi:hypothetical protein